MKFDSRQRILASAQQLVARRSYASVGLNEILHDAGVPKGSFYHYFDSKDSFGTALLDEYFRTYVAEMDEILGRRTARTADNVMAYWDQWRHDQSLEECQGKCLAVKLGAEVADLSESMRLSMKSGTDSIIARLTASLEAGVRDGSLSVPMSPGATARMLYDLWLGASVLTKVNRATTHLDEAMTATRTILRIA